MKAPFIGALAAGLWLVLTPSVTSWAQQPNGPPGGQIFCNQTTVGSGTGTIATHTTGTHIFVCGWDNEATVAAAAWQLSYGTGTTCGSNTQAVSPAYSALPAGTVIVDPAVGAVIQVPAGNDLCVTTDTNVVYLIYWAQY